MVGWMGTDVLLGCTRMGVFAAGTVEVGSKGMGVLKLEPGVRGVAVLIKYRNGVRVGVMLGVIVGMALGKAVLDAVGVGPVAVGKGPSSACSVRASAVLVLLAFRGFLIGVGVRNADPTMTIKPINKVQIVKAFK